MLQCFMHLGIYFSSLLYFHASLQCAANCKFAAVSLHSLGAPLHVWSSMAIHIC